MKCVYPNCTNPEIDACRLLGHQLVEKPFLDPASEGNQSLSGLYKIHIEAQESDIASILGFLNECVFKSPVGIVVEPPSGLSDPKPKE